MATSGAFAHLLAAKLDGTARAHRHEESRGVPIGTSPLDGERHGPRHGAWPTGAYVYAAAAPPRPVASRARRSVRTLSRAQRDALTAFQRLGAPLPDDFDDCQLKAAFRRLALELHPDRHPGVGREQQQRLELRFAVLCEAYRALRPWSSSSTPRR